MKIDKLSLKDKYYYYKELFYFYFKNIYLDDNEFRIMLKSLWYSIRLSIFFLIINTILSIIKLSRYIYEIN